METPKTIYKAWMDRVWNQLDASGIDAMLAADAPIHGLGDEPVTGVEGFKQFHAAFAASFSDINIQVERQIVSGDEVAAYWTGTMVHRSTGKTVPMSGMGFAVVRDGKFQEGWNCADFLPMLTGLGVVPPDAVDRALG